MCAKRGWRAKTNLQKSFFVVRCAPMPKPSPEIKVSIPSLKPYLKGEEGIAFARRLGGRISYGVVTKQEEDDDEEPLPARSHRSARSVCGGVPQKAYEMEGLVSPAEYKFDPSKVKERLALHNDVMKLGSKSERDYEQSYNDERGGSFKTSVYTVRDKFKEGIQSQIIAGGLYADFIGTLRSVKQGRYETPNVYAALEFFLEYLPAFINTLSGSGVSIILRTFADISYDKNPEFMHSVVDSLLDAPSLRDIESLDAGTACPILVNCFMLEYPDPDHPVLKKLIKRIQDLIDADQIRRHTTPKIPGFLHGINLFTGLFKGTDKLFQENKDTRPGTWSPENEAMYEAVKEILGEDFTVFKNEREEKTDYELDVGIHSKKRTSYPKIDIECDGRAHRTVESLNDKFRRKVLKAVGWEVVRFRNEDIILGRYRFTGAVNPYLQGQVLQKLTKKGLFFSEQYFQRKAKKDAETAKRFGGLDIGQVRKEAMQIAVYNGFDIGLRGDELRKIALVVSRQVDQVLDSPDSPDIPTIAKGIEEAVKAVLEHKKENVIKT